MKDLDIKFKKHESFYIREGWVEKGINTRHDANTNIFFKNDGIEYLGIGSNMVKSLKYWMRAANLLTNSKDNGLSDFANLLLIYDQYLDSEFSWQLIHYFLASNLEECPVFNLTFNSGLKSFSKQNLLEYLKASLDDLQIKANVKSIEDDMNVFIKSYVNEEVITNPEDNYQCPLSGLKLIKNENGVYRMVRPQYSNLSYLVVYFALVKCFKLELKDAAGISFDIDDSMELTNSPARIFNLDKFLYQKYLEDMRRAGLITINKTAGLNTVYFEKTLSLEDIFELNFKGESI